MTEMRAIVSGKVQGVAYRAYIQDAAMKLGLAGYISNLSDGTVEIVAQGEQATLKDLVEYINEGSLLSKVQGVDVEWRTADKAYEDFSIIY